MKLRKKAKRLLTALALSFFMLVLGGVAVTFAQDKDVSSVSVMDLHDLSGAYTRGLHAENTTIGNFTANQNQAFRARVIMQPEHAELPIGIFQEPGVGTFSANGYYLMVNKDTGLRIAEGSPVQGNLSTLVSCEVIPAMYEANGFILEFGGMQLVDEESQSFTRIYVKVNDESVLTFDDYEQNNLLTEVIADSYNKCTMFTAETQAVTATAMDLFELSGANSRGLYEENTTIGHFTPKTEGTSSAGNQAFRARVILQPEHAPLPIGIFQEPGVGTHSGNGYYLVIDREAGLRVAEGSFAFNTLTTLVSCEVIPKMYDSDGFDLEFGAEDHTYGGEKVCDRVYVKINGEEVLSYYDYIPNNLLTHMISDSYNKCVMYTTKAETESAEGMDLQELSGHASRGFLEENTTVGNFAREGGNYAFKTNVVLKPNHIELPIGIFQERGVGTFSANGYYLMVNKDTGLRIAEGSPVQGNLSTLVSCEVIPAMYDADGFLLEIGAERYVNNGQTVYDRIYVKINGEEVLTYNDYTPNNLLTEVVVDSYNKCMMYTTKPLTSGTIEVMDFYELTGKYFRGAREENTTIANAEKNTDLAFQARVVLLPDHKELPIGIFQEPGVGTHSGNGYYLVINRETGLRIAEGSIARNELTTLVSCEVIPEMYKTEGFILEFGVQSFVFDGEKVYDRVYVKVNGEEVLTYNDYSPNNLLTEMISDSYGKCEMYAVELPDVKPEKTVIQDISELWGAYHRNIDEENTLLGFSPDNTSYAFKARLTLWNQHPELPIGIYQEQGVGTYSGNGYYLIVNRETGISLAIGSYMHHTLEVLTSRGVMEEMYAPEGFELEFGATEYKTGDTLVFRRVYVKINGEEALRFDDYGTRNLLTSVYADTYGKCSMDTTYKMTGAEVKTKDWYDVNGTFKIHYTQIEFLMGNFDSVRNSSFIADITFDDTVFTREKPFTLPFFKATDEIYDTQYSGYKFNITDNAIALWSYDYYKHASAPRPASVIPGGTVRLEIGSADCYLNEEWIGLKIFVKIDGVEVLSLIDETPLPYNGTYIIWPLENGNIGMTFETTRDTLCVVSDPSNEHIDILDETTMFDTDHNTFFIPVDVGYILSEVLLDGVPVTFTEVSGGYSIEIPQGRGTCTLKVTANPKTVSIALPEDGASYSAEGLLDGKFAYRGNLTLRIVPEKGKIVSRIEWNGSDVTAETELKDGIYTLVRYGVTEDAEVHVVYQDAQFTLTAADSANGSVTLSVSSVSAGGSAEVTITPDEGYIIESVQVNGKTVSVDSKGVYRIENIYENISVSAQFAKAEVPAATGGCNKSSAASGGATALLLAIAAAVGCVRKGRL